MHGVSAASQVVAVIAVFQSELNAQPRLFQFPLAFLADIGHAESGPKMLRGEARAGGMLEAGKR